MGFPSASTTRSGFRYAAAVASSACRCNSACSACSSCAALNFCLRFRMQNHIRKRRPAINAIPPAAAPTITPIGVDFDVCEFMTTEGELAVAEGVTVIVREGLGVKRAVEEGALWRTMEVEAGF
jgi:hypothetical protein